MIRRVKLTAPDKHTLRAFLAGSGADFGCRAIAWQEGDGVTTIALADSTALDELSKRASGPLQIEYLDALPDPRSRIALVSNRNRFLSGELPRGYGERTIP